jgi:hypothetical protein
MTKGELYAKKIVEAHLKDVMRSYKRGSLLEAQVIVKIFKSFDYIANGKGHKKNGVDKGNTNTNKGGS